MIIIVDYGMGNLASIQNMFKRIGVPASVESDPHRISSASKIILPGVGSFDAAMSRILSYPGLLEVLNTKAQIEKVPTLGVCLGMQLLMRSSQEGKLPGLSWMPGDTLKFPPKQGFKVPHMGWNLATPTGHSTFTDGLQPDSRYYFVHSYYVKVDNPLHSLMTSNYILEFNSAIQKENIIGFQFHPEKSHRFGMELFKKFAEL